MAIVQDAYYIPDDIATGLATGLYRRIGSVVRYAIGPNKGQIVKHLEPLELQLPKHARGLGYKAIEFMQHHKKGVVVTAGMAVLGAGVWGYTKWKKREPKALAKFRGALKVYIDAIRNGNMDISKINDLMISLDEMKVHKDYEKISIQLTAEELEVLVNRIHDYTVKLALDNSVSLKEDELNMNGGAIITLQSYLKVQKKIFEDAA